MALTAIARYGNRVGASLVSQNSYIVRTAAKIFAGALVGLDPNSGALANWSSASAANLRFLGLAMPVSAEFVTGAQTAVPPPEMPVNESGLILEGVTVAGALPIVGGNTKGPGQAVFATDENTFTLTATSNVGSIGRVVRCTVAGIADIQLHTPAEYMALESLGKV